MIERETGALPPQFQLRAALGITALLALLLGTFRCVGSVWHTDGEVLYALAVLAFAILSLGVLVLWFNGAKRTAVVLSLTICAPFMLRQSLLMRRLEKMREEVLRIAAYVESEKEATGQYPPDLDRLQLKHFRYANLIQYWPPQAGWDESYAISYDLYDGDTTNREYGPSGWYYYPD